MKVRHDPASPSATTGASAGGPAEVAPQVLVVDDSRQVRDFLALLLRLKGYRVLTAANGVVAQTLLKDSRPALVISDLVMPVGSGWDVLSYCHEHHPRLPVLIISGAALGRRPDVERWAAGFIPKPFNLVRLHEEVERLIHLAA